MIIGISGKAQVGKDTLGHALIRRGKAFGVHIETRSFADKLKQMAITHFNLTRQQAYGTAEDKETVDSRWGLTPRTILQEIGQGYRKIYENYWVDVVLNELDSSKHYAITDTRYKNEHSGIVNAGGIVVRMERPTELRGEVSNPNHSSEVDLDDSEFDLVFHNDGAIELVDSFADIIIEKYLTEGNQNGERHNSTKQN